MAHHVKDVLSTGEVAKICNVAPRTVSKWFDSGDLTGYRIPGSRDRRIPLKSLIRFMKKHGMPVNDLIPNVIRVLLISSEPDIAEVLAKILNDTERYQATICTNSFQAGVMTQKYLPHILLMDVETPGIDSDEILAEIRRNEDMQLCQVIALHSFTHEGNEIALRNAGCRTVRKPFHVRQIIETIDEAVAVIY